MMKTKKKYLFLSIILVVLIMGASIGGTMAYFTTYTAARGGHTLKLGSSTRITEDYENGLKQLTITNDEDSEVPVYVRAKVFKANPDHELSIYGDGWTQELPAGWVTKEGDEDYWYCTAQVDPGASAAILNVAISKLEDNDADFEEGDAVSVVVIYESTPVKYQEDGTPYADWNSILDNGTSTSEGGND